MSFEIRLDFQDGNGLIDIQDQVFCETLRKTERMFSNDLKPVINTCEFVMNRRPSVFNSIIESEDDVLVEIDEDSVPWFRGRLRKNNFTFNLSTWTEPAKIECWDNTSLFKKKISTTQQFANHKPVSTTPAQSIFHKLAGQAGIASAALSLYLVDKTIDYLVTIENEQTYEQVLSKLLFEFGYVYYQQPDGTINFYDLFPADTSTTDKLQSSDNGNNMLGSLNLDLNDRSYEAVRVKYYTHQTITSAVVFTETTGGDDVYKANIPVAAGAYWPENSNTTDTFLEYQVNDREVITVSNPVVTIAASPYIAQQEFTNFFKRARVSYRNTDSASHDINLFDITGDAVVKGDLVYTIREIVENTERIQELECEHITQEADAIRLATGLSNYYRYGNKIFTVRSKDEFDVGRIIDLIEQYNLNFNITCVIQDKIINPFVQEYTYKLVPIEPYVAGDVTTTAIHTQPNPINPGTVGNVVPESGSYVTYTEVITGFDAGGGTTTPTQPVIDKYQGVFKGVQIQWDRQLDLTNFDRYEVQVSDDGSDWYSLAFDLTDWKDTLDAKTEWPNEFLVQPVPPGGTTTAPTSVTLFYHVRRVTKEPVYSTWSNMVTVATSVIDTGDIAEDSILANKILASEINTLLLRATDSVIVGNNADNANPAEGDLRTRIDDEIIRIAEQYTGGDWSMIKGIVLGLLTCLIGCQGIYHPESPPASTELLPTWRFELFNFDGNYNNQYGADEWTSKTQAAIDSSDYKFGTGSLYSNSTYNGSIRTNTKCRLGYSFSIGFWLKCTKLTSGSIAPIHLSTVTNEVIIYIATTYIRLEVTKNSSTLQEDFDFTIADSAWHYIAVAYNSTTDTIYFVIDNMITSYVVGGTWGTGFFELIVSTANNYQSNITCKMDELVIGYTDFINAELFIQHYNHNIPWVTTYTASDIILRSRLDGRIFFDDQQTVRSAGTLHPIPVESRPSTFIIAGATSTSYADVDCSAYVPIGITGVYVNIIINEIDSTSHGANEYVLARFRRKGSTTDSNACNENYVGSAGNINGNYTVTTNAMFIETNEKGIFQYKLSFTGCTGNIYITLLGYYY